MASNIWALRRAPTLAPPITPGVSRLVGPPFATGLAKVGNPPDPVIHFRRAKGRFAIMRSCSRSQADQPFEVDVGFWVRLSEQLTGIA